jgi:hypothetical protein
MQKLVECEHCHGEKMCKADHGRSCEVCRRAVGVGRRGRPTPIRCSYCKGHGRMWIEVAAEAASEAKPAVETETPVEPEAPAAAE